MSNTVLFQYDSCEDLRYKKSAAQYYLSVPAFFSEENHANDEIDFLLDTGAYLSVLSRHTAINFGFDKFTPIRTDIDLNGFSGKCKGDLIELPGLVIGGKMLKGAKVAIPQAIEGINILGLNVLEYFKYLVDSMDCKIYFSRNYDYKMPEKLSCTSIHSIFHNSSLLKTDVSRVDDTLNKKAAESVVILKQLLSVEADLEDVYMAGHDAYREEAVCRLLASGMSVEDVGVVLNIEVEMVRMIEGDNKATVIPEYAEELKNTQKRPKVFCANANFPPGYASISGTP